MKRTTKKHTPPADATPGFWSKLTDASDLGAAMLILEDEEGAYEPVGSVCSIGEAREIAHSHFVARVKRAEGLCPYEYKVWARGIDGGS